MNRLFSVAPLAPGGNQRQENSDAFLLELRRDFLFEAGPSLNRKPTSLSQREQRVC